MKRLLVILTLMLAVLVACAPVEPTPTDTPLPTPTQTSVLPTPQAEGRADGGQFEKTETQNTMEEIQMSDIALLLTAAGFLSLVANRLVEGLVTPIFTKFGWEKFWLMYVAWAIGGVLVGVSGVNLFAVVPGADVPATLGLILSGLVAGGGSNFMNELFDTFGQGGSNE